MAAPHPTPGPCDAEMMRKAEEAVRKQLGYEDVTARDCTDAFLDGSLVYVDNDDNNDEEFYVYFEDDDLRRPRAIENTVGIIQLVQDRTNASWNLVTLRRMLGSFGPASIIAIIVTISACVFAFRSDNPKEFISPALTAIIAYYFGHQVERTRR